MNDWKRTAIIAWIGWAISVCSWVVAQMTIHDLNKTIDIQKQHIAVLEGR